MMGRIDEEKKTVEMMVRLYCRRYEKNKLLCTDCSELLEYAWAKLDRCKFGDSKPTCRKCPVHCYKPDMRKRMKIIMKWTGPRMIIHHPVEAVKHLIRELLK